MGEYPTSRDMYLIHNGHAQIIDSYNPLDFLECQLLYNLFMPFIMSVRHVL